MVVKIDGGTFLIGCGHDTQAVHFMLNGLTFLQCLHDVLLDHSLDAAKKLCGECPGRNRDTQRYGLKAGNVLGLKTLGTLLHFKLYCLTLVQGLVAVHLNGGEVHENVFSRLPLDEAVPL